MDVWALWVSLLLVSSLSPGFAASLPFLSMFFPWATDESTGEESSTDTPKSQDQQVTQLRNRMERAQTCQCTCGLGEPGKSAKIVNGEEAGKGEFPWHVGITYKGRFYCGGAVINDRYVLTAAHCVYGINSNRLGIVAREFDRGNPNDLDTLVLKPQRIVIHPNFVRDTFENDVAVVRLDRALPLSGTGEVPPVCLPGASDIHNAFVNETGVVTGWGRVLESGQTSKTLQKVGVPIMSNDDCKTKTSYEAKEILDSMMCAGYKEGGKDACQGDSGGPLHWKSPSGKQYLVGIVSWGRGCARRGLPGVYTRITKFLPWIYDNTPDGCYCREREPRFG